MRRGRRKSASAGHERCKGSCDGGYGGVLFVPEDLLEGEMRELRSWKPLLLLVYSKRGLIGDAQNGSSA